MEREDTDTLCRVPTVKLGQPRRHRVSWKFHVTVYQLHPLSSNLASFLLSLPLLPQVFNSSCQVVDKHQVEVKQTYPKEGCVQWDNRLHIVMH